MAATVEQLEEIIRSELREPVEQIVRRVVVELVREQLNGASTENVLQRAQSAPGATQAPTAAPVPLATTTRICRACGQERLLSEFESGRATCRPCRRAQERERQARRQAPADEEPHPSPRRARARHGGVDQWLLQAGFAQERDGELVATDVGRELASAIFDPR